MKVRGIGLSCAALVSLAGVPAQVAQAAESADSSPVAIDEVVVTAQFREQRLQDTPIAITAMSAEMLEARSQTSSQDFAN